MTDEWFRSAFETVYLDLYGHRSDDAAEREVNSIAPALEYDGDSVLLDLGCGNGRHAKAWSTLGLSVVGFDLSRDLLKAARARQLANSVFFEGDMRRLPFEACFDIVTSMFTSFGYFQESEDDHAVIRGVARALKPRGIFVFDFLNAEKIRRELVPESFDQMGEFQVRQKRTISEDGLRVEKEVTMVRADGWRREHRESVRLYEASDFERMFQREGIEIKNTFGDFDRSPWNKDSPRLILLGRKSERVDD